MSDVELHVDVHDAGAQASRGRGSCHAASRPHAPGPSAEPAGGRTPRPREPGAAPWPGLHSSARRRPRGKVAATTARPLPPAAPSFFLVSACRKWLRADVTSALQRGAGAELRRGPSRPLHVVERREEGGARSPRQLLLFRGPWKNKVAAICAAGAV